MTDAPSTADLAQRAAALRVAVVGGGVSGLVAARECAALGMQVTVFEAGSTLGGAVRRGEAAGVQFDAGAESFATRGGHVQALIGELGLADAVVDPVPQGAWVVGLPDAPGAAPLPKDSILGIPSNPFAEDVRAVIGWRGVWRAYLDRLRPNLTIGHEHSLGRLVRRRMGDAVVDQLVAPVVAGVYSAHVDDVDVEVAAPGLNAALTRVGSLASAVAVLKGDSTTKAPGAAVRGLDGGMSRLVDALAEAVELLRVQVRTDSPVAAMERTDDEGWRVHLAGVDAADAPAEGDVEGELFDAVILAVDETTARSLLADSVPALGAVDAAASPRIEIVTLVLDAPELDAAPRGTGVLTVPGSYRAKALTHATAKWPWLRERANGRHVVRVSFGTQGDAPATEALDDDAATQLALDEAAAMLGVPLTPSQVLGSYRASFTQTQPASVIGARERRAKARAAIVDVPGLAAVGAWLAGTGLAQVIPDARSEADRLRRSLLWSTENT